MRVPEGYTEKEVIDVIDLIARSLAPKFRFGYHSIEDIEQYARLFAINGLDAYDESRGKIKTFLWTHVRNRLSSLKRDQYERHKPCFRCPFNAYDPHKQYSYNGCTKYSDMMDCSLYHSWYKRNSAKKNIMSPIGMANVKDDQEENMKVYSDNADDLDMSIIMNNIDQDIPVKYRKIWIRFCSGSKLSKSEYRLLISVVKEIVNDKEEETE